MKGLTPRQQLRVRDKEVLEQFLRQVPRSGRVRRPFALREKAAVLIMRKHGARIQHIAKLTGRSTSVIYRILRRNERFGHNLDVWRRRLDMRKMEGKQRLHASCVAWNKLVSLWSKIEAWILGEGDKPP